MKGICPNIKYFDMVSEKIHVLEERCIGFFTDNNYTENRISKYRGLWRIGIERFLKAKGTDVYNTNLGAEFITTCHFHGTVRPKNGRKSAASRCWMTCSLSAISASVAISQSSMLSKVRLDRRWRN